MAEGFSAGTVYVDVVPRSNPAANQQVGQQIGRDIQNAMGVSGGGGGGGMGGGGGGGGSSGNMPVGVVSAKMAAAAAEARLQGVMGGNSYVGLQGYASEVALQSSWASRNMPKSAFDYRMQAKSSDADRRLMEIDSRVSTFSRDPNAHVKAFMSDAALGGVSASPLSHVAAYESNAASRGMLTLGRNANAQVAAYQQYQAGQAMNAYAYGGVPDAHVSAFRADYAGNMAAMRGELKRDAYLRGTSRVGPSFDMEDMAALGVPSPTAGSQFDAHVAARTASMRPSAMSRFGSGLYRTLGGQRGFRMAGFQAMFGAMDVASAYNASVDADNAYGRGDPVAGVNADFAVADAVKGSMFGGPAMAFRQFWDRKTGRAVFGDDSAYSAREGMKRGIADVAAGAERLTASGRARLEASLTGHAATTAGIAGSVERQVREARFMPVAASLEVEQQKSELRNKINISTDPAEQQRLGQDLKALASSGLAKVLAAGRLGDATAGAVLRDANLQYRITGRARAGLLSAARGEFGQAGELDFEADLQNDQDTAAVHWGPLGALVGGLNTLRRAGRRAMHSSSAEGERAEATAFRQLAQGNERGAVITRQAERTRSTLANTPDVLKGDVGVKLVAQDAYEGLQQDIAIQRRMLPLKARLAGLQISAFDSSPYGNARGDITELVALAKGEAGALRMEGRVGESNDTLKGAGLELRKMGMEIARGFRAVGVSDPTTIDAYFSGTSAPATGNKSDPTKILEDILRAIKDLGVQ